MLTAGEIRQYIRDEAWKAGSLLALSRKWDINRTYLWHVIHGKKTPGPLLLERMGMCAITLYRPKEVEGEQV